MTEPKKIVHWVTVSDELLTGNQLIFRYDPLLAGQAPSESDKRAMLQQREALEQGAVRRMREAEAMHALVLADHAGLAHEIAKLHAPVRNGYQVVCKGCPPGDDWEEWPCRTYEIFLSERG